MTIQSKGKVKIHIFPRLLQTVFFTFIFCAVFSFTLVIAASDIRVGLKALYMGKKIITIYNTDIKMGYCVNDSFKAELELKSKSGFSFEPDNGTYYCDNTVYTSYSKASAALKKAKGGYICYAGRDTWLIYLTGVSDKEGYSAVSSKELLKICFGNKEILIDGNVSGGYPQFAPGGKEKTISLGSRSYRGRIEIGRYGNSTLTAINVVNIESYLLSVVSCEMNSTWHREAQKAQAIAARSYCLASTGFGADSYLKKGYVIVDTDESQVYAGTGKETDMSRYAVKATYKKVLKVDGKILPAYFFSTSGGATEFSSDIWGGNSSSFVSVFDEYEIRPERAPWIIKTTFSELKDKLKNKGYSVGNITDVYPEIISDSGRVSSVKIKYSGGSVSVKGSELKSMYSMHSTKFKIITAKSDDFEVAVKSADGVEEKTNSDLYTISGSGQISAVNNTTDQLIAISSDNMTNFPLSVPEEDEIWILGMGWGHGIGMSQSGAYGMALKGYKYDEILKYYYKNTVISSY